MVLYDSGTLQLKEARELSPTERKRLAQDDFNYWFTNAEEFLIDSKSAFGRGSNSKAAFELHQVVERLYSGILLVFTRYKPSYVITSDELLLLYEQVEALKKIGQLICHEKINSFIEE